MGALIAGTALGVVFLTAAFCLGLSIPAALAAQSLGGISVTLIVAGVQSRAAARRARTAAHERDAAQSRPAGHPERPCGKLRPQSA